MQESVEKRKRRDQERADNKIWEKFFEDINETYSDLERVKFCWKERGIYNRKNEKKKEHYWHIMLKGDDLGGFDFQNRFYRKWLVSPPKRSQKRRVDDECCCRGNHLLRRVLDDNRYLGVYDVFDLLDLMNLKIKDPTQCRGGLPKESQSADLNKRREENKGTFGSEDDLSVKSEDTIISGEGYAALLNLSSESTGTNSVSGSWGKGQDQRMDQQVVDQVVDSLLWKKAQFHFLQNQEAGAEFRPETHSAETFKIKFYLHEYLNLWRPVYCASRTKVFFQIKRRIEFGGDSNGGWDSSRRTTYLPVRNPQGGRPRNFVLVRHINKQNKKVFTPDKGLLSVFANDWVQSLGAEVVKEKMDIHVDSRGNFKISKQRLEELVPKFNRIRESFLRLRFYITRERVEFFQKHFDFINFLLLETRMMKESLICETSSDFTMFWREYESECCYASKCLQCVNSLRHQDNPGTDARVSVQVFDSALSVFVLESFDKKFTELARGLGEPSKKFICDCIQEHLYFFEFLCKAFEVLCKNNISVART